MKPRHAQHFSFRCLALVTFAIATSHANASPITGYLYKINVSGTFGTTIDPKGSNLPDSTYPFPEIRGGSFGGTFVYDSLAFLDQQPPANSGRFPFVSVNINIFDNHGALANTITISPNNFGVTNHAIGLNFGESVGPVNRIDDLRLQLDGDFTLALPPPPLHEPGWGWFRDAVAPPHPDEITAAALSSGFLETDGQVPFTYWDLPVTNVVLTHVGTTSYLRNVVLPDGGNTIFLLSLGILGLLAARAVFIPEEKNYCAFSRIPEPLLRAQKARLFSELRNKQPLAQHFSKPTRY